MYVFKGWNAELSTLAALTANKCDFAHDNCRNTDQFKTVGQNIAEYKSRSVTIDFKVVIGLIIDSWLKQAENCNMKLIESYRMNAGRFEYVANLQ